MQKNKREIVLALDPVDEALLGASAKRHNRSLEEETSAVLDVALMNLVCRYFPGELVEYMREKQGENQ